MAHECLTRTPRTFTCHQPATRNLIVCIDGTSNRFGTRNTNIVELYSHISKTDKQLTYYSSGLGTIAKVDGSSLGRQLSNNVDAAIGRNLHKVIMASYRWLSDNYQDGDRIYLFGYSRGAYQVRALAGMIARVGLLLPGNNEQIPFAFELYSKTDDDDPSLTRPASIISRPVKESKRKAKYTELAKTFQKTFCRSNVHIHFVGVWDTVSSVGLSRGKPLPCTTTSCEHICYFRHALALDERRVKFLPEYVYGGSSSCRDDGRIKEVWFAGCHGDVGGGNRRNEKLQSGDIPLLWMRSQAIDAGLQMEPADVMWKIDDLNKHIKDSLHLQWWLLEMLPLNRLQYYNSDMQTSRPHFGDPRIILPGQKVHVSVLFKNNYKPSARILINPDKSGWPEPMFWNDVTSHQRLQTLPDLWERDIFDDRSVQTLLDDLKRGQANLDALDRLAFMASFDVCKEAISNYKDAKQVLVTFLNSKNKLIRLSATVTFCELGWDLPSETNRDQLRQEITSDVSELLKDERDHRRACIYMPSLCKREDLRAGLINDENLKELVRLCDTGRITRDEEGTSTDAFHSAQALSMLMKLEDQLAQRLIVINAVTDITVALRSTCSPALVSLLIVLNGLAKHEDGRATMRAASTLPTLLKLVKQFDDFVAPAATRVICSLLPEKELRDVMHRYGVLSTFLEMLDRCSAETKQVVCDALIQFAAHRDIQQVLTQDGYLRRLAEQVQGKTPSKCEGAIFALVALGNTPVKGAVVEVIEAEKTIQVLVARLHHKSTALFAAWALAQLVRIDGVTEMVSGDKTGACLSIVGMLRRRWFDGLRGEDGLQVLSELLKCKPLRTAVLEARAMDVLRDMVGSEHYGSSYAGLHYLQVIVGFDEGKSVLPSHDMLSLVPHVVSALRLPHRRVQRTAMVVLQLLFAEDNLRVPIIDNLLGLLRERRASVLFATSTALRALATDGSARDRVLTDETFRNLSYEYYDGLTSLEYDEKGKGPRTAEVYDAVGHLIKLMQVSEHDDADGAEKGEEKRGPAHIPYEPEKEKRRGVLWIATLLYCPALLCGLGRRVSRELWQEG